MSYFTLSVTNYWYMFCCFACLHVTWFRIIRNVFLTSKHRLKLCWVCSEKYPLPVKTFETRGSPTLGSPWSASRNCYNRPVRCTLIFFNQGDGCSAKEPCTGFQIFYKCWQGSAWINFVCTQYTPFIDRISRSAKTVWNIAIFATFRHVWKKVMVFPYCWNDIFIFNQIPDIFRYL